ncbi:acylphosphatase [Lyngbya sp. PCC 8106]|uniref:acylphosphatase n=1 Tax=Lyngbya sp. (strain PCC 8106) TaxID=313612 RepID=UPI0000EA95AC|nr:acylphosphatase [Lyngbya sp. PCC 8106]EAW35029.1 Acylphosphatase [Lyngbya sp. PCC 8106]
MPNSSPSSTQRVRLIISGRVQGVGFRFSTREAAIQRNVNGWVRNLSDGRVEAVLEGSQPDVKSMIEWCHQGPPAAVVQQVSVHQESPKGLQDFEISR